MRGGDIQDVLLSLKEVAAFAWSLLELLLTRILPLVGFLAGHLLLHLTRLLASGVNPTAGRRVPRAEENFRYVEAEAEGIEEPDNAVQHRDADYQNEYSESLKRTDDELEEGQLILREDRSLIHADAGGAAATPAAAELAYHDEDVADMAPSNLLAPVTEAQVRAGDVAESSPSDHDLQRIPTGSSDTAAANEVQARSNEQRHAAEADKPLTLDVAGIEQGNVSSKEEGSTGKMDLQPSDVQTREEASTSEEALSTTRASRGGGEMRKSSRRRMRVLPPSLSQIRRTLMERSTRRASPSPQTSPDAMQTPSASDPITQKKKKTLRGSRKRASPSSIKASSSNNSFMRNFRKHFLMDPPNL